MYIWVRSSRLVLCTVEPHTVINGPKKIGCINRVAVLPGYSQIHDYMAVMANNCILTSRTTVPFSKQQECTYSNCPEYSTAQR